jgi:thymidylate kinase
MIIEFFGPAGVGKTTLARALTLRLREHGLKVEPMMSCREGEKLQPLEDHHGNNVRRGRTLAAALHLAQRTGETLLTAPRLWTNAHEVNIALKLLRLIPPTNITWSIRLYRYILHLSRSWHRASLASHIVLFDQGFVQAVYSLVLLGRVADDGLVALALDSVPKSDLLIRLDAPQEMLEARLCDRLRLQNRIERLLEPDLKALLESTHIIDHLHDLLRKRDRPVTRVNSLDQPSLCEAVEWIEREVTARYSAEQDAATLSRQAQGACL